MIIIVVCRKNHDLHASTLLFLESANRGQPVVTNSLIRRIFSVHLTAVFVGVSACRGGLRKQRKHLLGALTPRTRSRKCLSGTLRKTSPHHLCPRLSCFRGISRLISVQEPRLWRQGLLALYRIMEQLPIPALRSLLSAYEPSRQMHVLHIPRPERKAVQPGYTVETLQLCSAVLRHQSYVLISIGVERRTYGSNLRGICKARTRTLFSPTCRSKALYYARERIWLCPIRLAVHEHRTSCIHTRPSRRFNAWFIADFWRFGKSEVGDTDGGNAVEASCDITWPGEMK